FRFGDGSPAVTITSPNPPVASHIYAGAGVYRASLQVTDVRGKTSINIAEQFITVSENVPGVLSVVSRKSHGAAGSFDIPLPLQNSLGVEPRSGGPGKNYTMIFSFEHNVLSVAGVDITGGNGTISSAVVGPNTNQFTVNLSNVETQQAVEVTLSNVLDSSGATISAVQATMGVLIGDVTHDQSVNSGDSQVTRSRSGQLANGANFRSDVNTDGAINSGDAIIVRSRSGNAIIGQ
ncbi:MAG TPA: dockerin type I domain-containing protein, partial [Chthoniobacterales bacterium]